MILFFIKSALSNFFYEGWKKKYTYYEGGDSACPPFTALRFCDDDVVPNQSYRIERSYSGGVETPVSVQVFCEFSAQPKIYSDLPNNYHIPCEI